MIFKSLDHVYKCKPPVLGNLKAEDPFYVGLSVIPAEEKADFDQWSIGVVDQFDQGKASDLIKQRVHDLIASHVHFFEGLKVGDREIKTFEDCFKYAPPEVFNWVYSAVYSTQTLTAAEVKN